jgi:hypothetical protein
MKILKEFNPKQRAALLIEEMKLSFAIHCPKLSKQLAIKIQESNIEKLSEYDIYSEYEKEILTELKK